MFNWRNLFKDGVLPPPTVEEPEKTVVYLRTDGITPARFMEREVKYDAWGTPYVHADSHHTDPYFTNTLKPNGRSSNQWLEWKHKSGPAVSFPDPSDPEKSWFPKNPNDDLPL